MALSLDKSVGKSGGINKTRDVVIVQTLLGAYFSKQGPAGAAVVAKWTFAAYNSALGDAIAKFQAEQRFPVQDGRIDPGGRSWRKLIELIGELPIPPIPNVPDQPPPALLTIQRQDPGYTGTEFDARQLAMPDDVTRSWPIQFGGSAERTMVHWYYECPANAKTFYIGVCLPQGVRDPDAYLIYFHHPIIQDPSPYKSRIDHLKFGIGDYLFGRFQLARQVATSGKNICLVIPSPDFAMQGEFLTNEKFAIEALKQIDSDVLGIPSNDHAPLILAGYSGGAKDLGRFMSGMPTLASKVKAVYDFDGDWIRDFRNTTFGSMAAKGVQVIRYKGGTAPEPSGSVDPDRSLAMTVAGNPMNVPLPASRWRSHARFPKRPDGWWMHHYIPTCMLKHALRATTFLR
jgi:hypothetical protein